MNKKPVVLVVMDGVGESDKTFGNAVTNAYTPTLDYLKANSPWTKIKAHGTAVGLPSDDDMGNSEVGHNAIGCGQVYSQGAKLVNESIESGSIYQSETWKKLIENAKGHTLHFLGLLSDGNVHSNIKHLKAMITEAKKEGINRVRVHCLMDGRDVPDTSGLIYINDLEEHMASLNDDTFDAKIASGGGRMYITMDRYEADWDMVRRGWDVHVAGIGRKFNSATEAIETYRQEGGYDDQNLPEFVICENDVPVGTIEDHDSVIFFNFRGDRALEISRAFDNNGYKFNKSKEVDVMYAGMLEYDGDLHIPTNYLVNPPEIKNTMSEYFVKYGVPTYAISETQKFGHVTYFWNGNRSEKFDENLETWVEIKSDLCPFDQRPWMKSSDITDKLVEAIDSKKYTFLRTNYPNGDMVGHTGDYDAAIKAVETVDECIGKILKNISLDEYTMIIIADHGNCEVMRNKDGSINTSHTTNLVPFIVLDKKVKLLDGKLGDVAPTILYLMGLDIPSEMTGNILIKNRKK